MIGGSCAMSPCRTHRFLLGREIQSPLPGPPRSVCWVMLNPSTADSQVDDPTIRRCMGFSKRWNFHNMLVVNLCSYRTPSPAVLFDEEEVGPEWWNAPGHLDTIRGAVRACDLVVVAWGAHGAKLPEEVARVCAILDEEECAPSCLGTTKSGQPRHPLYIAAATELQPWARP